MQAAHMLEMLLQCLALACRQQRAAIFAAFAIPHGQLLARKVQVQIALQQLPIQKQQR